MTDHDKRAARQQRITNAVRGRMDDRLVQAKSIDGGMTDAIDVVHCGDLAIAVQSDVVWDALSQVRQVIMLERNVAKCDNGDARAATISALIGSMSDRDRAELLRALIKDHAAKSEVRYQVEVAIAALQSITITYRPRPTSRLAEVLAIAALQSITITDRPRPTSRPAEVLETLVINAAESVQLIASQLEALREL